MNKEKKDNIIIEKLENKGKKGQGKTNSEIDDSWEFFHATDKGGYTII